MSNLLNNDKDLFIKYAFYDMRAYSLFWLVSLWNLWEYVKQELIGRFLRVTYSLIDKFTVLTLLSLCDRNLTLFTSNMMTKIVYM